MRVVSYVICIMVSLFPISRVRRPAAADLARNGRSVPTYTSQIPSSRVRQTDPEQCGWDTTGTPAVAGGRRKGRGATDAER